VKMFFEKWYIKLLEMKEESYMKKLTREFIHEICFSNDAIRLIVENDADTEEDMVKEFRAKLDEYKEYVYNKIEYQK